MSEPTIDTTAAPSTADIASQTIEALEGAAPSSETPSPETPTPSAPETPAVVEPPLSPAAQFLIHKGHKHGKRPDGKTDLSWMPFSTVEKFLDDYVGQHRSTWDGEKTSLSKERDQFKADLEEYYRAIQGEPRSFLELLSGHDPRYKAFLESQALVPPPQPATLPEPDVTLQDGSRTFSMEAFQTSIIPYIVQQAKAEAKAEAENALKPLKEREAQAQITSRQQQKWAVMKAEAQTWPLFGAFPADGSLTPFQTQVLEALKADQGLDLRGAYMKVALPLLTEDDAKKRERIAKELSAAAAQTPTVGRSTGATPTAAPASTRDIAAKVIAHMER